MAAHIRKRIGETLDRLHIPRRVAFRLGAGLLLFFSFLKFPATELMDTPHQSWEAAMAYAVPHHWQWGADAVYTYGPLSFLSLDYYWGYNFAPILVWAILFALVLTVVTVRLLERGDRLLGAGFCVLLPWLTVPRNVDLGLDPIYLFAIAVFGLSCLPTEKPKGATLSILGAMLGLLGLFKFTLLAYCALTLLTVSIAYLARRQIRQPAIFLGNAAGAFLVAWLLLRQHLANLVPWLRYSWQIAAGYPAALAFPPASQQLVFALCAWTALAALAVSCLRNAASRNEEISKLLLLAAGVFLAWKESFVQAEQYHVAVFFLFAFLVAMVMHAIFAARPVSNVSLLLTVAAAGLALAPLLSEGSHFLPAIKQQAGRRAADTFTALFAPTHYKHRLEANLAARRAQMALPELAPMAGDSPTAVLNMDQDFGVLNGFNYVPHPVIQNYSAYTPGLQKLNADFFASDKAPEFLLWRYGTVGNRFPTLDDGQIILTALNAYEPVRLEEPFVLWKRKSGHAEPFRFVPGTNGTVHLDEWIPIPAKPTWLKLEVKRTWRDSVRGFVFQPSFAAIEVRLEDGSTKTFYLVPGSAEAGFLVNPLMNSAADLVLAAAGKKYPTRVVAVRVFSRPGRFVDSVKFSTATIEGVTALDPSTQVNP